MMIIMLDIVKEWHRIVKRIKYIFFCVFVPKQPRHEVPFKLKFLLHIECKVALMIQTINKIEHTYNLKEGALISKVWLTHTHQIDYSKKWKKFNKWIINSGINY